MDLPKRSRADKFWGFGSTLLKIWIFATFLPFASGSTKSTYFQVTSCVSSSTGSSHVASSTSSSHVTSSTGSSHVPSSTGSSHVTSSTGSSHVTVSTTWSYPSNCFSVCVCGSKGNGASSVAGLTTSILASSPSSRVNMSYSTISNHSSFLHNTPSSMAGSASSILACRPSSSVTMSFSTSRVNMSYSTISNHSSFLHNTPSSMAGSASSILACSPSCSVTMSYSTSFIPKDSSFSSSPFALDSTASLPMSMASIPAETCRIEVQCNTSAFSVSAIYNGANSYNSQEDLPTGTQKTQTGTSYDVSTTLSGTVTSFIAYTSSTTSTATSTSSENTQISSVSPTSFASSTVADDSTTATSSSSAKETSTETISTHSTAILTTSQISLTSSISTIYSTLSTISHGTEASSTDTSTNSASPSLVTVSSISSSLTPSVLSTFSTPSISSSPATSSITSATTIKVSSVANPSFTSPSASSLISTTSPDSTSVISPSATVTVLASSSVQIVYAPAPQVTSVKFSETAAKILIQFNVEVQFVSAEETCDEFFIPATLTTLGSYPQCRLSHTQELQIIPGVGANISVGDLLEFKAGVFKARNEKYGKFLNGSFAVNLPDVPLKPVPVIKGPNVLSSCGNLSLSGTQSFGSGGRPLIIKWSLISPNSGSDFIAITNILSNLSSQDDRVKIPGSLFEANKTYLFRLEVANFLNTSRFEETSHSVIKVSDPVPELTLSSSIDLSEGEVFVSEDFYIRTTVTVAPCANDTRVDFSWAVTCSDASAKKRVEFSAAFNATRYQSTLKITRGLLTGEVNCTFTVTVRMKYNPSVKTSMSQVIKALPSPLEAAILGGDRLIGRNSGSITLDAKTLTIDPDGTKHELSCSWSCAVQGGGLCNSTVNNELIFSAVNGCIIAVQSNHFFAGKKYIISVDVTKGFRSAAASIKLTVVEGNPPAVWVNVAHIRMNSNDRLKLQGYYKTNTEPAKVEWSSSQEQGFSFVELSGYNPATSFNPGNDSFVLLTLPVNLLKPDSKYRFKLTVNDGSEEGVASLTVEVRKGPTARPSAGLSVSPSSVQALDVVTLSAPGWETDLDAFPLRYSFGLLVEKDVCETFGIPSSDSEREQMVPQGSGPDYILPLCVVVLDKFDSFKIETFNITSSPPSSDVLTPNALERLLQNAVDDPLQSGDVDAALGAIMSIVGTVQQSNNTEDEFRNNISRRTEEIVFDILESTVIDQDIAFPLLSVLVKTNVTASDNSSRTANAAVIILQGLDDKPLPDDLAGNFYSWIADLADDSIDNNDGLKETVGDALEKFADNIGTDLQCGDPPREVSDDRLGSVKVQVAGLKEEIVSSSKPGAPRFDPGPQLTKEYSGLRKCGEGKICCGVFLKMVRYKKDLIVADKSKQRDDSQVVSSQIIGVDLRDPITKTPIVIQSLTHPLKLVFIILSVPKDKKLGCVYFDEDKKVWVKTGLNAIGLVSSEFTCESTHATYFAPSHDSVVTKEQSSTDLTRGIVGLVMGFLMGIVAVLLVLLFIWWKRKQKVTTELPQLDHRL